VVEERKLKRKGEEKKEKGVVGYDFKKKDQGREDEGERKGTSRCRFFCVEKGKKNVDR